MFNIVIECQNEGLAKNICRALVDLKDCDTTGNTSLSLVHNGHIVKSWYLGCNVNIDSVDFIVVDSDEESVGDVVFDYVYFTDTDKTPAMKWDKLFRGLIYTGDNLDDICKMSGLRAVVDENLPSSSPVLVDDDYYYFNLQVGDCVMFERGSPGIPLRVSSDDIDRFVKVDSRNGDDLFHL